MSNNDEHLRYPIGKFSPKDSYSQEEVNESIRRIGELPDKIEAAFKGLTSTQLDTPYRDGGWTARQVIHHLADSHMNAYIRIKWALTEDTPLIKAYDEKKWAETAEVSDDPIMSIALLKALHFKLVRLLSAVKPEEYKKAFTHPDTKKQVSIERMMATYAWHGEHHLGHLNIIASK